MRRDYFARLSRAARWYLPPAEAAEVLEDYREIVEGRSEEELRRDVGTPKDAVGQLAQLKAYQKWLTVFAVMTVCAGLPAAAPVLERLFFWNLVYRVSAIAPVLLLAGTALALLWFRREGNRAGRLPKAIPVLLGLFLLGMVWVWFLAALILSENWEMWGVLASVIRPQLVHLELVTQSLLMGAAGIFGLIKARLYDRRWRAVYVLGLAGAVLTMSLWAVLSSLALDVSSPGWQTPILVRYAVITLLGLAGAGAALC